MSRLTINAIEVRQLPVTPLDPAAGNTLLYSRTNQKIYALTAGGVETLVGPITKTDLGLNNVQNVDQTNAGNLASGTLLDGRFPTRLGTSSRTVTDWNNATDSGWYQSTGAALNVPVSGQLTGLVTALDSNNLIQRVTDVSANVQYSRPRASGVWGVWERTTPDNSTGVLIWSGSSYPPRPNSGNALYMGPVNPDYLGLMISGDVWIDTSTPSPDEPDAFTFTDNGDGSATVTVNSFTNNDDGSGTADLNVTSITDNGDGSATVVY